jgi:hypothetical protein
VETTDRVNVTNENGAKMSETDFGRKALEQTGARVVVGKLVDVPVKTGKSFTYPLNVNELYDLSHPGKYTIQVQRMDPDSKVLVKSNTITVTVTP